MLHQRPISLVGVFQSQNVVGDCRGRSSPPPVTHMGSSNLGCPTPVNIHGLDHIPSAPSNIQGLAPGTFLPRVPTPSTDIYGSLTSSLTTPWWISMASGLSSSFRYLYLCHMNNNPAYQDLTIEKITEVLSECFYGKQQSSGRGIIVYPLNPEAFHRELNKAMKEEARRTLK